MIELRRDDPGMVLLQWPNAAPDPMDTLTARRRWQLLLTRL